ncbi:MAG: ATP-dependent RNA helicase [Crocinitomicaceae bacterium]|nr:ATP-dependent RNA helicase [Crocinitomicaceae bacterium]
MDSFDTLGLSAPILKAIGQLGFETPTDIQSQAIPHLLEGDRDFIGLAQTGTGKTAAFGLPLLDHLDPSDDSVQALILAPTRELGQQIAEQIDLFSKHLKGIKSVAVYGGANISTQISQLKRPRHVVIATPGRLIDLVKRKALKLDQIKYLVLDEADEMLNMGFKDELDTILEFTPDTKKTWLFSATMPREIRRMVKQYMESPFEVSVDPKTTVNANIEHRYAVVKQADKTEAMSRFLELEPDLYGVVFCRTRRDTQALAEDLLKMGFRADALHGEMSQPQRDRVMSRFKNRDLQVLIATDVAARGIDVNDLTHVFHHSLPSEQAYYTHRSGRTARAGKKGISLAFISNREKGYVNRMSREMDISFEAVDIPGAEEIVQARMMNWAKEVLDQKAFDRVPFDLIMQMNLLFEETPKDEMIARLVARELARLNVDSGRDINQRAQQDGDRSPQRRSSSGGYSRSRSYSKPRGGFKKSGGGGSSSGNGRKNRSTANGSSSSDRKKYGGFGKSGGTGNSGGGFKKRKSGGKGKRTGFGSKPFRG